MSNEASINSSEFAMWRAVFALAHLDDYVHENERAFMEDTIKKHSFTEDQTRTLRQDIGMARDIKALFTQITEQKHRTNFFRLARLMVWCDGDFDLQEKAILDRLKRQHIEDMDFQQMIKEVDLAFEDDEKEKLKARMREMTRAIEEETKGKNIFSRMMNKVTGQNKK